MRSTNTLGKNTNLANKENFRHWKPNRTQKAQKIWRKNKVSKTKEALVKKLKYLQTLQASFVLK